MTLGRSLRLAGRASDLYGKLLGAAMLLMLGLLFTIPIVHTLPLSVQGVRVDPSAVSEAVLPWFMTLLVLFPSCSRSDTSSTWPPSAKTVGSW